jgi:hypothetical protein
MMLRSMLLTSLVTICSVISSCTAKMSVIARSYRSAQRCEDVAASINCAVTRTRSPDRRTLPSST